MDGAEGDAAVHLGSHRCGALPATAMVLGSVLCLTLSGCANIDYEAGGWFSKPLDLFGRSSGYTFSELQETRKQRTIAANELVDGNGACAAPVMAQPAAPPGSPAAAAPGNPPAGPAGSAAASPAAESLLGGGIALGMSECDVVYRAGSPSAVQLGKNPNGDRTAVLTYNSGPRPGIYRFERGSLMEMDRVAEPAPPPQPSKKKPAKASKPPKDNQA